MTILMILLIVGAAGIAILSQVRPTPNILWVAVLLLAIAVAVVYLPAHL
jgi:hypothetical protein